MTPQFGFGGAHIIGWCDKRRGFRDVQDNDTIDFLGEFAEMGKTGGEGVELLGARFGKTRASLEAITLARKGIDKIDLHRVIRLQVRYCPRRSYVAEHDVVVVEQQHGAFGRQVWCSIGAHGRDETEFLFRDDPLHIARQDSHCRLRGAMQAASGRPQRWSSSEEVATQKEPLSE